MELTMGIAVGSSIQIAAGMIPLLVLVGWAMNKDLTVRFTTCPFRLLHPGTKADLCALLSGRFTALLRRFRDHHPLRFRLARQHSHFGRIDELG